MDPTAAGRPVARVAQDTEERWRELSAELDAADEELRRLQPPEGTLITPELFEQLEAAKRRRYKVQFAMIDFLDTLDEMPP
ncbi:MAG: hypothetical protein KIT60_18640 [Burkholderiaceae bacterium]|nr:hypothetical protein [Burkholderiaceae bacterium]